MTGHHLARMLESRVAAAARSAVRADLALVIGLLLALSTGSFATIRTVVVARPAAGGDYQMVGSGVQTVLDGTAKMTNVVMGDIDGDGAEDEMVYSDATTGALRYYKIPPDGRWDASRDHAVNTYAFDPVPQAILRTSATETPGVIVYSSAMDGTSYAVTAGSSDDVSLGVLTRAYGADARGQGFKGDLWAQNASGPFWDEGAGGTRHALFDSNYVPYGAGNVIPGKPGSVLCFVYAPQQQVYFSDKDGIWTKLMDSEGAWGFGSGMPFAFGDMNGDGRDETIFTGSATSGVRYYVPLDPIIYSGGPWTACPNGGTTVNMGALPGSTVVGTTKVDAPDIVNVTRILDLKDLSDGAYVRIAGKVVTAIISALSATRNVNTTGYYIEEPDRTCGIQVQGTGPAIGAAIMLEGQLVTDASGERAIKASYWEEAAVPFYAVKADGTARTVLGSFKEVATGDVDGDSVNREIIFHRNDNSIVWRSGVDGDDQLVTTDGGKYRVQGTGALSNGNPEHRILCWDSGGAWAVLNTSGAEIVMPSATADWGYVTSGGDIDGDGLMEMLFFNVAVQWAKFGPNGAYDSTTWYGEWLTWTPKFGAPLAVTTLSGKKVVVGVVPTGVGVYIPNNYIPGAYQSGNGVVQALDGTATMKNFVLGDCNGDGLDEIVYQDSGTGALGYYEIPTDTAFHPGNVHALGVHGSPKGVIHGTDGSAWIVYQGKEPVLPLGVTGNAPNGTGLKMSGLQVRMAANVVARDQDSGSFTVMNGSTPTKVYCQYPLPAIGKSVSFTGCVGTEVQGGVPASVVRMWAGARAVTLNQPSQTTWEFNTDGDTEGWTPESYVYGGVSAAGGSLLYTASNPDPNISTLCNLSAASYGHLVVGMKSDVGASAGVVWGNADGLGVQSFNITGDNQFHEYVVDLRAPAVWGLNWEGNIVYLRLDVPDNREGWTTANVAIDYIRLQP